MDGHYEGPIIFLLGRFVFVVMVGAFLSICTPHAQKSRVDRSQEVSVVLNLVLLRYDSFIWTHGHQRVTRLPRPGSRTWCVRLLDVCRRVAGAVA